MITASSVKLLLLSKDAFTRVVVKESNRISPSTVVLRLVPPPEYDAFAPLPVCFSLSVCNFDCSEQRPYTPINDIKDYKSPIFHLDLLVKKYPGGIISGFLSSRSPGDTVDIRGPFLKLDLDECLERHSILGLIAGGTGITPMLQIIRYSLSMNRSNIQLRLLYGNVLEDEILLREELDDLAKASNGRLVVRYAVDGPSDKFAGFHGQISTEMIRDFIGPPSDDLKVFVCGPPGMMRALAGGGRKEPLGGVLHELGYTNVHKY